jgi:hypothetical protein
MGVYNSGCQLLPDWLEVNIAIAFKLDPVSVVYEVKFEKLLQFYRSHDHRLPDGTFPMDYASVNEWRTSYTLQATVA